MKPAEAPAKNKPAHDQYERYLAYWVLMAGALTATIVVWTSGMLLSFWFNQNTNQSINITGTVQVYGVSDVDRSLLSESIKSAVTDSLRIELTEVDDRLGETWSAIQGIGLISAVIGVLITVLVLYFSFQNSASIARAEDRLKEAEDKLFESAKIAATNTAAQTVADITGSKVKEYLECHVDPNGGDKAEIERPDTGNSTMISHIVRNSIDPLLKSYFDNNPSVIPNAINSNRRSIADIFAAFLEEEIDEGGGFKKKRINIYIHKAMAATSTSQSNTEGDVKAGKIAASVDAIIKNLIQRDIFTYDDKYIFFVVTIDNKLKQVKFVKTVSPDMVSRLSYKSKEALEFEIDKINEQLNGSPPTALNVDELLIKFYDLTMVFP